MSSASVGGGRCLECERLRERVRVLEEDNRLLRERLEKLEESSECGGWYKPRIKGAGKCRKPGRKRGHKGSGRSRPDHVDAVLQVTTRECPHCQTLLGDSFDVRSRFVTDVPPPSRAYVVEYQIHRYWCPTCKKNIEDTPSEALPYYRLGNGVWSWAWIFHHQLNVPYGKIRWWMRETWGLHVTESALTQGLDSIAGHLKPVYDGMVLDARQSPYNHVDETGCRVEGSNWWTWVLTNPHQTIYHTDPSRGSQVPLKILGKDYPGAIISDDYSSYNPLPYTKQACWVHLLRKAREPLEKKKKATTEQKRLHTTLQNIYHDIKNYQKKPPPDKDGRKQAHRRFQRRLNRIVQKKHSSPESQKVANRIQRRQKEYLTCILQPHLPPENNPAERKLKNQASHRKQSTLRSPQSAQTHNILQTLLTTQLQKTPNPLHATQQILQKIHTTPTENTNHLN